MWTATRNESGRVLAAPDSRNFRYMCRTSHPRFGLYREQRSHLWQPTSANRESSHARYCRGDRERPQTDAEAWSHEFIGAPYAFADGEETCKIYIEFAAGELRSRRTEEDGSARHCLDAGVVASFERRRVRVVVVVPNAAGDDSRREFAVNLACDIVPKHCSYKVAPEKHRVVVSLRKAEAVPWPTLACAAP